MKKLLFLIAIAGLSLPAMADVLVYNVTQAEVEMQGTSNTWSQSQGSFKDFFVIEPQSDGTADVQAVMTYKAKDSSGKMQNYYTTQNLGSFSFLQVTINSKQQWILTATNNGMQIVLSGLWTAGKKAPGDHGNGPHCSNCHSGRADRAPTPACAPSLTGSSVWDQTDGADRTIGTAKVTLKLDTKTTALALQNSYTTSEAVNYIVGILTSKNYIQGN